ncbi:MAG: DUF1285 domain-containing protein [Stellaceae bacterium]|jgi:hypothetical protein
MDDKDKAQAELARLASSAARPAAGAKTAPRDCGYFDIHIARDGSWFYRGSSINRMALVRLFAGVLERDAEGQYWLSTPAERGRITVEDAPFLAVSLESRNPGSPLQALTFRTNLDQSVTLDGDHPLRVTPDEVTGGPIPYILVRDRLEARLARPVFYELVELGREERVGDTTLFGVWSKGKFFPLGSLNQHL